MKINIFLFQRDLRLSDNRGLYEALKSQNRVLPIYCWPEEDFNATETGALRRLEFIYYQTIAINSELKSFGSELLSYKKSCLDVIGELIHQFEIESVYTNNTYEPQEQKMADELKATLEKKGIHFYSFKDDVIFEKGQILKSDNTPYTIFTPYSKKWLANISPEDTISYPSEKYLSNLVQTTDGHFRPSDIPVQKTNLLDEVFKSPYLNKAKISAYDKTRDFPAQNATSLLSVHFRYGTLSIRQAVRFAIEHSKTWLNELIWREFFKMILWHFPDVVNNSFKRKYDNISWRNNDQEFEAWKSGNTGYPMVDAGMHELNATGFMHNRVRMVVASFLTKHLLIDWRWGEAYFAEQLLDYELSANNGNWQWVAGSGCDAAPYFRVFNPENQQQKFDSKLQYILKWVPETGTITYAQPIVEHAMARNRAIETYKKALNE